MCEQVQKCCVHGSSAPPLHQECVVQQLLQLCEGIYIPHACARNLVMVF